LAASFYLWTQLGIVRPETVIFQLSDHTVEFPAFVADIPDDCLLVADFLKVYKAVIDFQSDSVQFTLPNGVPLRLVCLGVTPTPGCHLVKVFRTAGPLHVAGGEELVLSADPGPGREKDWVYVIEPIPIGNKRARRGHPSRLSELFVPRSTESGEADEILISINNPSTVSFDLPAGTAFAECTVIPENVDFPNPVVNRAETTEGSSATPIPASDSEKEAEFPDFPPVLQHLIENTPVGTEQRHRLKSILYRRRNDFSLHGELDFTSKVCRGIDTGDAPPIKQQPRPVPFFGRKIDAVVHLFFLFF